MRILNQSLLLSIGALTLVGAAVAQVPSSNDTSDANANTGMGSGALGGPTPAHLTGTGNTASGYAALSANTTGAENTASGYGALEFNSTGANNTAYGAFALFNSNADDNTAAGYLALNSNTSGVQNTAVGSWALATNGTGSENVAVGYQALTVSGVNANTAVGWQALSSDTTGANNAAFGASALALNQIGTGDVAVGYGALYKNTASNNTAIGWQSLNTNSSGAANTASGAAALFANTTGIDNTAAGYEALFGNTTGGYNTASGYEALLDNTTGQQNTASGVYALHDNKTGNYNAASGVDALYSNTAGSSNIAEGYKAGFKVTTGSNNIDIGNQGEAAESGAIRIGTKSTHTATYIAGIYGTSVTGSAVVVSSTGQLGVTVSSERFKTAIAPMGLSSTRLERLRPVTFHLKSDPQGALQYGLIAEEVAKVYPELVIRDEHGRIDGVRYDELAPMLLNEMQQQQRRNEAQAGKIATLGEESAGQDAEIRALKRQMAELTAINQATQVALQKLLAREEFVVQR